MSVSKHERIKLTPEALAIEEDKRLWRLAHTMLRDQSKASIRVWLSKQEKSFASDMSRRLKTVVNNKKGR